MKSATAVLRLACISALIGSVGCFRLARTEPVQEYFVLGAGADVGEEAPAVTTDLAVGVRRLKIASYLASPFIVVRRGESQVDFAEFRRWAEPLESGINRVVARALVARGVREVDVAPWPARARYDYGIQLDVVRFEGVAPDDPAATEGGVLLSITWEITGRPDGELVARGTTGYERPGWRVGDHAGLVRLLDAGLDVLADDLATALAGLPPVTDGGGPSIRGLRASSGTW